VHNDEWNENESEMNVGDCGAVCVFMREVLSVGINTMQCKQYGKAMNGAVIEWNKEA